MQKIFHTILAFTFTLPLFPQQNSFSHFLGNFKKVDFPYQTNQSAPTRMAGADSEFVRKAFAKKNILVKVTDPSALTWTDADEEGKVHFDDPEISGAGTMSIPYKNIYLLEIVDMYELIGPSATNKQGVFKRTTYLCTFTKDGKFISGIVSNLELSNEHGTLSRWKCEVNSPNEIIVKEYGTRTEEKDNYGFKTTLKITPEGKFVKVKTEKGQ